MKNKGINIAKKKKQWRKKKGRSDENRRQAKASTKNGEKKKKKKKIGSKENIKAAWRHGRNQAWQNISNINQWRGNISSA